ncbi:MAG: LON peptidase substrate-binding domain-containing protein [Candidatus Kapabacteria bacterium]|jgi:Lon protease-like protein|nr:LON peptidase substrate-binding domain-containing protein [Candidatus Kapabacteria bacterium]
MEKIGIFSLKKVLFPDSLVPLHIFEERYLRLVHEAYNNKYVFGINLDASVKVFETGCIAEIVDIVKEYTDGRKDILIKGGRRYRMNSYGKSDQLWNTAEIEYFNDREEDADKALAEQCISKYNEIAEKVKKQFYIKKLDASNATDLRLSFLIAQKSGMSLVERQNLLGMTSENERLKILMSHFNKMLPLIKEAGLISEIIRNDGYYDPKYFK